MCTKYKFHWGWKIKATEEINHMTGNNNSVCLMYQVSATVEYLTWYRGALWDWNVSMHSHSALYSEKNALNLWILGQVWWFRMLNLCYQRSSTQNFGHFKPFMKIKCIIGKSLVILNLSWKLNVLLATAHFWKFYTFLNLDFHN